ncbi:MAG: sigma-70 family RNA polymerase sigma factor [Planctomycetota bacterium]|jgi:hypothetical protein
MVDREACERRVYRLATLLTGNPLAATSVIAQVVGAQPDLSRLDSAHLDRLTILRSREIPAAALVSDLVPVSDAATLAGLPFQVREAWVLARVYRLSAREMARAMDCSLTATTRHLDQADAAMGATGEGAAASILAFSQSLDVPGFYRAEQRRRRRVRQVILPVAAGVALIGVILLIQWLRGRGILG